MNHACGAGYRVSWVVALVFVSVVTVESRAQNTTFNESIGPSLNDISEVRTNTLIGRYRVTDNVLNASGIGWTGLEIVAETQVGPDLFAPSGPGDGLSFDEPALFSDWRAAVTVAMDSISQGPAGGTWDVVRDDDPVDTITFTFSAFAVQPGEMLTLGFDMNDQAGANTWRLNQTAIPEPAGAMVLVIGCVFIARRPSVSPRRLTSGPRRPAQRERAHRSRTDQLRPRRRDDAKADAKRRETRDERARHSERRLCAARNLGTTVGASSPTRDPSLRKASVRDDGCRGDEAVRDGVCREC